MPVDPARANSLVLAASYLPLGERAAFLDRECRTDADLRHRVEVLLAADAPDATSAFDPSMTTGLPDANAPDATNTVDPSGTKGPSKATNDHHQQDVAARTIIGGKYTLVEPIGEGGMGSVYRAEQTEPVKRQVALKLIKAGMDSGAVLARFDAERQALALMDHPNIARIYDGGVTERGQPFFVMELVRGMPLTDYCDQQRLSVEARLQLFVQVCNAVQHAHQKGIIHRDLKPGNVLVTEVDGRPTPKVIDFGVAKATEQKLTEMSIADAGAIVGTPAYMSPEQADPSSMDIDTRSDVYALGVILYELLTGSPPIDASQFKRGAIFEMLRMVREVDAPRPSTKLSTADALPNIASNRNIEPAKLSRLLQGELDWVVMKALEKDRNRRYETASGFAADVLRYLADEVVEARPPSRGYRLRKFVKRNKVQVVAVSLVLLALVGGIAGTTYGLIRARQSAEAERAARVHADKATVAEKEANARAQLRLKQVEEGNEILTAIFTDIDYRSVRAGQQPLEAAIAGSLVKAGKRLEGESLGDPMAMALLQSRLALSLLYLGYPKEAIDLFEKARATFKSRLGDEHPNALMCTNSLAACHSALGELNKSIPLFEETWRIQKATLGPDHPDTLTSMANLASDYDDAGQIDKAIPLLEESYKFRELKLGADHPDTLSSLNNLAIGYYAQKKYDRAVPLLEETLRRRKAVLGIDHPDTLGATINLGSCYRQQGQIKKALEMFQEVVQLQKKKLGPEHPDTLTGMNNLAFTLNLDGQTELALPLWEETVRLRKIKLGPEHPETLSAMAFLAKAYQTLKQPGKSLLLQDELFLIRKAKLGPDAHETRDCLFELATACCRATQPERAVGLFAEYFVTLRKQPKLSQAALALKLLDAAFELMSVKQLAEAEVYLRECLAIRAKIQPDAWTTFNTQSLLGGVLLGQKKYADAEPLLLEGYAGMKARATTIPPQGGTRIPEALDRLIELYTATNKPDEVKKWQAEKAKQPTPKEVVPPLPVK